jgi:hypothetical protein
MVDWYINRSSACDHHSLLGFVPVSTKSDLMGRWVVIRRQVSPFGQCGGRAVLRHAPDHPPWPTEVSPTKTIGNRFACAGVIRAVCRYPCLRRCALPNRCANANSYKKLASSPYITLASSYLFDIRTDRPNSGRTAPLAASAPRQKSAPAVAGQHRRWEIY